VRRIATELPLESIDANYEGEVAERWRYRDGGGEIGVISSVTRAFCRDCTRARLSTEGKLYLCLFANHGYDLRALLRGDERTPAATNEQLETVIGHIWSLRADRYSELRTEATAKLPKVEMSYIGG
jgi:cyclic pyranopterin phosphate synthase